MFTARKLSVVAPYAVVADACLALYVDSVGVAELLELLGLEFGVEVREGDSLSDELSKIEGTACVVYHTR